MYNFDKITDRRGTGAIKWNVSETELPMWVADMDFETAPEIIDALQKRISHGVFGYTDLPEEWYQAYISWWEKRHHFTMKKEWLGFCTGVIPAISSVIRRLTAPGDNVLILTPVYNHFFYCIRNNGRTVLESRLQYTGDAYEIDFADLEEKLKDPLTTVFLFCNPQNPTGQIWDAGTLDRIGRLCAENHVTVISDEIHCDLTDPGTEYVPFASVSDVCRENSVTCIAPTKTFSIPGLQTAAVVVPQEDLRNKVKRALSVDENCEPGALAVTAAIAAYEQGEGWLDALRAYIRENEEIVRSYIRERIPAIKVLPSEATYLLWIDCSGICKDEAEPAARIRKKSGLFLTEGSIYGGNGEKFVRMNTACPRPLLMDGLGRLEKAVMELQH